MTLCSLETFSKNWNGLQKCSIMCPPLSWSLGGDHFVFSQKRFWFSPGLTPGTGTKCTSILLDYEPLPSLGWLPSLPWTSAYTLLTALTPPFTQSCHSWLIKLVLCQVNHSLKSWVSHLIVSSFYHWIKYSTVWPILCMCFFVLSYKHKSLTTRDWINFSTMIFSFSLFYRKKFLRCVFLFPLNIFSH